MSAQHTPGLTIGQAMVAAENEGLRHITREEALSALADLVAVIPHPWPGLAPTLEAALKKALTVLKMAKDWENSIAKAIGGTPAETPPAAGAIDAREHEGTLYEHEDGRYAVAAGQKSPAFTYGDPKWHRVGPVDVSALAASATPAEVVAWRYRNESFEPWTYVDGSRKPEWPWKAPQVEPLALASREEAAASAAPELLEASQPFAMIHPRNDCDISTMLAEALAELRLIKGHLKAIAKAPGL
jgi:hypothetical protein